MKSNSAELVFLRRDDNLYGGAEIYLKRLSGALEKRSIRHRILASTLPRFLPSVLRVPGYAIAVCLGKGNDFYFSLERISCADIYRAGDGVHRQFMLSRPGHFKLLDHIYLYLEKRCFNNAAIIIANSEMVKQEIMQHYSIAAEKIRVIYSGVELNIQDNLSHSIRDEYHIDPASRIILFVGSGFERKGVRELLLLLSRTEADYCALIVGKDKHPDRYIELSRQLGIADRVIFTGPRTDVNQFYHDSDIFILPTRYEPFSNVVLEAMRGSNAVITTRQNGAAEVLRDEMVMATSTDTSIRRVLHRLLSDDDFLAAEKTRNRELVKNFSIEENARRTLEVIEQAMHSA